MPEEPHHVRAIEHITVPDCIMVLSTARKRTHLISLERSRRAEVLSKSLISIELTIEMTGISMKLKMIV